jgi:hypothetical protein
MFLETKIASSPPFQALSGWGAEPHATLNSYFLFFSLLIEENGILFLFYLCIFKFNYIILIQTDIIGYNL